VTRKKKNTMEYEQILEHFPYLHGFIPSAADNDAYESGLAENDTSDMRSQYPNLVRWRHHISSLPLIERQAWAATPPIGSVDCVGIE